MPRIISLYIAATLFALSSLSQALGETLEVAMAEFDGGDFAAAQAIWLDLAAEGDLDAAYNLGQLYHLGQGVAFNETTAAEYFLTAAQGGHTAAQRELASIYFFSSGTPEHQRAAIQWWQQAAANGDGRSQYILGVLLFNGDLVPQNMAQGFAWTLLAIEAGIPEAVQSEAAMRGQLPPGDLARSIDLSRTLMTSQIPNQAHYSLLVAELPARPIVVSSQGRRPAPPPTLVAEADQTVAAEGPEPETSAPVQDTPTQDSGQTLEENLGPPQQDIQKSEDEPVELAQENTPEEIEQLPEPAIDDPVTNSIDDESQTDVPLDEAEPIQQPEMSEALPAENDADVVEAETSQFEESATVEAQTITTQDLGDPLSPLVDAVGFEGQWRVQVTSFRKPENADQHWQNVNADYPEIFNGLEKRIVRADLGPERGVYYRLRIGPFESKDDADLKCQEMVDAGMGCLVIWP